MNELIETVHTVAAKWAAGMWPILWQSTVLAGIVLLLCRILRRAPAALRYWLWMFVALRLVVMPFITVSLPLLPAPVAPESTEAVPHPAPVIEPSANKVIVPAERPPTVPENVITPAAHPEAHRTRPVFPSVWAWLMAAWVAGVAVLSLRFAFGWRRMQRLVAGGGELIDPDLLRIAQGSARKLGLRKLPRILFTETRQLTLERERACDDRVLADGDTDRTVYARVLLSTVETTRASRVQISPAVVPLETFRSLKIRLTEVAEGFRRPAPRCIVVPSILSTITPLPPPRRVLSPILRSIHPGFPQSPR